MDNNHEDRLRSRAYEMWENAGKPDGEHESHWHQAAKELGLTSPAEQSPGTTVNVEPSRPKSDRSARTNSLPIAE